MAADVDAQRAVVGLKVGKMDLFNYALYQNKVSPIRDVQILNATSDPLEGLVLHVVSDLPIFKEFMAALPAIPVGKPVTISDLDLDVDGKALAGIDETVIANISVRIELNHEVIVAKNGQMRILAYDEWPGSVYTETLASFVMPNHPVVSGLLHDTAMRLQKWGKEPALEGYQCKDPNRIRDFVAAAYTAIQKKNIVYANPPATFVSGQHIRTPEIVMEQRLGTCMDLTLLYASCLEAIGLHPILVMKQGHIFAGVWLVEKSFDDIIIYDKNELIKRFDNKTDELTFIECTSMCSGKTENFEQAEALAKYGGLGDDKFVCAIDIICARQNGITPLPSRIKKDGVYQIEIEEKAEDKLSNAPKSLGISVAEVNTNARKITTKQGLWESKLLDLTRHNMLLSLPLNVNASVEPVMSTHIDELEDALADGEEFRLLPVPDFILIFKLIPDDKNEKKGKERLWLEEVVHRYGVYELTDWQIGQYDVDSKLRSEYRSHRLYTFCPPKELEKALTGIYRAARASQQENGVSSLYLAIGLLRWFDPADEEHPCYAPLVLLPVEIVRKSANQGYALHMRDEEPHFNTTLLEMLKQNFGIEVGGLDPMPGDEHGIDIRKVFATVRGAVLSLAKWDVVETCVIGNFSFTQFAMWNDLHNSEDFLNGSKIVRSLMKGYVDFDVALPLDLDAEKVYLPITVDGTQLRAIKMAAHGTTFVLHGPPGTGKSQTITGMIANLMAQGKSVLFVAEKMAALSVVQKRLSSLGIGDFCLELHSDKASKKQVLTQLEKALNVRRDDTPDDYAETWKRMQISRVHLDDYKEHLHKVQNCGYSLRELIELYEGVRDNPQTIRFDPYAVASISKGMMKQHIPLIRKLSAAGSSLDKIAASPLRNIGVENYTTDIRVGLQKLLPAYKEQLVSLKSSGQSMSELLRRPAPRSQKDFRDLNDLAVYCLTHAEILKEKQRLLQVNEEEVRSYYSEKRALDSEREKLLHTWQPAFLTTDIAVIQEQYEAAGKKFFGRGSALEKIRTSLQGAALVPISIEAIPSLLQEMQTYQSHQKEIEKLSDHLSQDARWAVTACQTEADYKKAVSEARAECKQAEALPGGMPSVLSLLASKDSRKTLEDFQNNYQRCVETEHSLNELLHREGESESDWITSEMDLCEVLSDNYAILKDWTLYNKARAACRENGLAPVVEAYEDGMPADDLVPAYEKGLYRELINYTIESDEVLSSFSGATFDESIRQFKRIDDLLLQQSRKEIFNMLAERVPSAWESPEIGLEINLLRKAIGSNARGMSIRELFERTPHILKRLTPCMLMSPNSVAQYLEKRNDLFDVVIFDEASQLPTCKAVGALARAKDAVIVGDPKQMPPTSFFAGGGPQVDDLALDDLDSILDDALALGIPSLHLQWHYRSTHESLIAFSNHEFYDNKMFTFPSANDRERHVTAVYVGGVYGKNINPKEAEAVVAEIVRRYHDAELSKQSIGVITFNVKQQLLIEDLLNRQFQKDPKLDAWANSGEDPIFVKNLENVQGDERDAILFSIGYGPDEKGHISMNFGPINKQGGGKRLNVAFSRARVSMTIFTSLYSSQIVVTESSPDGLKAFKDFLRFAEGKDFASVPSEETRKAGKDRILNGIAAAITEHGYQCVPMVGHSDFHVDLAVVDPNNPEEYLMGILLDGEGYRRTRNTRDREVAQIGVLKHLGWQLHRVWTIDWWDNREKEIKKILETLEQLREQSRKAQEQKKSEEEKEAREAAEKKQEEKKLADELATQAEDVISEEEENESSSTRMVGFNETDMTGAWTFQMPENKGNPQSVSSNEESGADNGDKADVDASERAVRVPTAAASSQQVMPKAKEAPKKDASPSQEEKSTTSQKMDAVEKDANKEEKADNGTLSQKLPAPVPYKKVEIPVTAMSVQEYCAAENRKELQKRAAQIIQEEAPILKDTLVKRLLASYNTYKSNPTLEATEKALRAVKVRNVKYRGVVFCWRQDQDPKAYDQIRVTTERSGDEISPQEIRNAMCYVLENQGPMDKDSLIKATSKTFGYGRVGKNIEAALENGLKFARSNGSIVAGEDKKFIRGN